MRGHSTICPKLVHSSRFGYIVTVHGNNQVMSLCMEIIYICLGFLYLNASRKTESIFWAEDLASNCNLIFHIEFLRKLKTEVRTEVSEKELVEPPAAKLRTDIPEVRTGSKIYKFQQSLRRTYWNLFWKLISLSQNWENKFEQSLRRTLWELTFQKIDFLKSELGK